MPSRMDPPKDSYKADIYRPKDQVYFWKAGLWRKGEVIKQDGSSSDSPIYEIANKENPESDETYRRWESDLVMRITENSAAPGSEAEVRNISG